MASLDSDEEDVRAVHRALNGDAQAFRFLVLKYADRMLSFCRSRSPSEEDAADAAQETFTRAYRSLRTFRVGSSFAAWLFAIAANRTRTNWARRFSDRIKVKRAEAEAFARSADDPEEDALRRIEIERIRSSVSDLSADLRVAVELYYFGELSVSETAQTLSVGEETIKSRLFRARKKLRVMLEGRNRKTEDEVL
ncbi:MAG: sigma-70 family RNA polymerase sigma factor [Treponemataceae bacterium]